MELPKTAVLVITRAEDELKAKRLLVLKEPEFVTIADHKFIFGIVQEELGGWRHGLEILVAPKDVREITIIPTGEEWEKRYMHLVAEREAMSAGEAIMNLGAEITIDDLGL